MISDLKISIDSALATEVEFRSVREDEAQVYVPFNFPDGDGLVVHVHRVGNRLEVTDRAHTLLHLSYHTDLKRLGEGQRASLLERIQSRHGIEDRNGEFVIASTWETVGADVFRFSQALLEISDLRNLDREIVRSTFREDFRDLIVERFPEAERDYVDRERDRGHDYPVPFLLNGTARPIAVFDVNSDERALEALVIARQLREWGHRMHVVAVEEDQESLTRKHVAWLSMAVDKQFPRLSGNGHDIVAYLTEQHALSRRLSQGAPTSGE